MATICVQAGAVSGAPSSTWPFGADGHSTTLSREPNTGRLAGWCQLTFRFTLRYRLSCSRYGSRYVSQRTRTVLTASGRMLPGSPLFGSW